MSKKISFGLTISEEVLGEGAPVIFQGSIEKGIIRAFRLGFDSVEIHLRNPGDFCPDKIKSLALKHGITVSAIGTGLEYSKNGLCFTSPDKDIRIRTQRRIREHIDFAANFKSVVFLGMLRGSTPRFSQRDEYLARLYEELVPVAAYARERGVALGFEPIAFYLTNLLNKTLETVEFLKRPGLENLGILFDTHHMFIEDNDIEESIGICGRKIEHVHISDSNRGYPGRGNGDFIKVCNALKKAEYEGCLSLECLPVPDPETVARKGLEKLYSLWY